jgi:hypothetical protein
MPRPVFNSVSRDFCREIATSSKKPPEQKKLFTPEWRPTKFASGMNFI